MRTVLAVIFRSKTPDEGWVAEMLKATGAERIVCSTPEGSAVGDIVHYNPASDCFGPCKVKWLSKVLSPLTYSACEGDHDAVYFIHDDVKPSPYIGLLELELDRYDVAVSAPIVVNESPLVLDVTSRCCLFKREAMPLITGEPIAEDLNTGGKTLIELLTPKIEQLGLRIKVTDIEVLTK